MRVREGGTERGTERGREGEGGRCGGRGGGEGGGRWGKCVCEHVVGVLTCTLPTAKPLHWHPFTKQCLLHTTHDQFTPTVMCTRV